MWGSALCCLVVVMTCLSGCSASDSTSPTDAVDAVDADGDDLSDASGGEVQEERDAEDASAEVTADVTETPDTAGGDALDALDTSDVTDVTDVTDTADVSVDALADTPEPPFDGADMAEPEATDGTGLDLEPPDSSDDAVPEADAQLDAAGWPDSEPTDTMPGDTATQDAAGPDDSAQTDATSDSMTPSCPSPCASGRLRFERRQPNADSTTLGPLELSPLAEQQLVLTFASGELRPHTQADGSFEAALPAGTADYTVTFAALVPQSEDDDTPSAAVLVGEGATLPTSFTQGVELTRVWAWSFDADVDSPADIVVGMAQGSGALAILETYRRANAEVAVELGEPSLTLAFVWYPGLSWSCLSCFLDGRYAKVSWVTTGDRVDFDRAIFISGSNNSPHHWTPSIIAHELGHWFLEVHSRPPLIGGTHSWDRRVDPVLGWSEGAASFIGQWSLRRFTSAPSRFFAVQQQVQYWVDLEAIGRSPTRDDSNLDFLVPLPRPNDPIEQQLSEAVVAAILWDLYDGDTTVDAESMALDADALLLLAAPRLASPLPPSNTWLDRGANGPDLVDLLDALRCDEGLLAQHGLDPSSSPSTFIEALRTVLLGYPYDDAPVCPLPAP